MKTGGCTMAVVSALFSCSAMDMPCTQHVSFPDAFAAAVGDAPQSAPVALLRLAGDGRVLHQIRLARHTAPCPGPGGTPCSANSTTTVARTGHLSAPTAAAT